MSFAAGPGTRLLREAIMANHSNHPLEDLDRRLERRLGRYAIRNLSLALILCYAFGYLISYVNAEFLNYLTLNPYAIVHGQVWRVVTWILIPPESSNFFFVLIMLFFYYSIGTALERTWGTWRYNEYIFGGMLFTVLGAFVLMAWGYLFDADILGQVGAGQYFQVYSQAFSTYYVNMSIFLAYAVTFPEMRVLFMFFIPVRVKILGIIYAVYIGYSLIVSSAPVRIAIVASLLNFVLLWLRSRDWRRISPSEIHRRAEWKRKTSAGAANAGGASRGTQPQPSGSGGAQAAPQGGASRAGVIHRCAVCGRTNLSDPQLDFRYCSKCEGSYEYCSEHIFTHIHVRSGDPSGFDENGRVRMRPKE